MCEGLSRQAASHRLLHAASATGLLRDIDATDRRRMLERLSDLDRNGRLHDATLRLLRHALQRQGPRPLRNPAPQSDWTPQSAVSDLIGPLPRSAS